MRRVWIIVASVVLLAGCVSSEGSRPSDYAALHPSPAQGASERAVSEAIGRIAQLDHRLHAVIALDPSAIEQARQLDGRPVIGPLHGVPILIKDNIETAGAVPTTAGSLALKDNVTGRDAPLIARLRGAGMVVLGKTNLSEWANIRANESISGWSAIGGQVRNPHAFDRNPCGSSSGSGAAVAAGYVDYAIGTETDGSVTCPAAVNGIVGLKPTVGLVSRSRIIPISASQDTAGPMTRTLAGAAQLLTVIAGSDPADPATAEADRHRRDYAAALTTASLKGKRLGVMRFASGFGTDPAFEAALSVLKSQGAELVEIKQFDRSGIGQNELTVLLTELKAGLNAYLATTDPARVPTRSLADVIAFNRANAQTEMALFDQGLFVDAEATKGLNDPAYRKARKASFQAAGPEGIDKLMRTHRLDALIGPTMPPAWKIDAVNGDQIAGGGAGGLAAVAGYPHLTVPMGFVRGLPVGLSFIAGKWQDDVVLSLGYAYERARGPLPPPRFVESIESVPPIAPLLEPQHR